MTQKPSKPAAKRGRPAHAPTASTRRRVSVAAGAGMRHQDIATALGISHDTLARHYEVELSEGALARRLEVLNAMHTAAKKGQSSAARVYLEHSPQFSVPPAHAAETKPAPPAKTPALGKKEQAQADAHTAALGTDWDSLLTPPQVQ